MDVLAARVGEHDRPPERRAARRSSAAPSASGGSVVSGSGVSVSLVTGSVESDVSLVTGPVEWGGSVAPDGSVVSSASDDGGSVESGRTAAVVAGTVLAGAAGVVARRRRGRCIGRCTRRLRRCGVVGRARAEEEQRERRGEDERAAGHGAEASVGAVMARSRNVLLITLDQFRGDCLSCAGHPLVRTPNLDALAADGVRLARHYSQATPCAPGRAALYTGMYQMNNRVVANGTPLDSRFDNVALAARRAGYAAGAVRLHRPGGRPPRRRRIRTTRACRPTRACCPASTRCSISRSGYEPYPRVARRRVATTSRRASAGSSSTEHERPAEHSVSAFVTDDGDRSGCAARTDRGSRTSATSGRTRRTRRPGEWGQAYDPADVDMPIALAEERHPFHDLVLQQPERGGAGRRGTDPADPRAVLRHGQRGRRASSAGCGTRCASSARGTTR